MQCFEERRESAATPVLEPCRDDALVLSRGLGHLSAFIDRMRDGLFDVDMLAGLAGPDGQQRVPVVGRGRDDCIDVLAVEHGPQVGCRERVGELIGLAAKVLLVGVTQAGDGDVFQTRERAEQALAASAQSNERNADFVIRSEHLCGRAKRQGTGTDSCGLHQGSSCIACLHEGFLPGKCQSSLISRM